MDKKSKVTSHEFRASEDEGLMSALDALTKLQNSNIAGQEKKPAKKKIKNKNKGRRGSNATTGDVFEYSWPKCVCGMNHPPVPFFKPPDGKRCNYYWQLADMFPLMTLHRVLTSEISFIEADKDRSGVLEMNEVENLLQFIMGTDLKGPQIGPAFKQIDLDDSGTLDFTEVLTVIDGIIQRKPSTKIPQPVKQELSKVCSIQ